MSLPKPPFKPQGIEAIYEEGLAFLVVATGATPIPVEQQRVFRRQVFEERQKQGLPPLPIIICYDVESVRGLNEAQMEKLGWVRKK